MERYLSGDMHFGHANIITYSGRPFDDVEAMNQGLVEAWNETVGCDDEVWVLGDVAMGRLDETLEYVDLLNGRKILLAGNHDRCWAGHGRKAAAANERYLDAGFCEIVQGTIELDIGVRHLVLADHFPYVGDSRAQERYQEWRPADRGRWLMHGHVHELWRQRGRMINVGVDAWAGCPVSFDSVAELVRRGSRNLERLEWS